MKPKKQAHKSLKKTSIKHRKRPQKALPRFKRERLCEAALHHPSFRNENPALKFCDDFDRLEFFGDSVLNFVICRKLYKLFPTADEGVLSRLRSILVSRKILARIAKETGFTKHLKLGKGLAAQDDFLNAKMHADGFEAFIAAVYFDRGFEKAERFLLNCFRGYFDIKKLFRLDPNPKSTLQELSQRHWQKLPVYQSQQTEGGITTIVAINRRKQAKAFGRNRQESEESAARLLIRSLRQDLLGRSKRRSSGRKLRKTF